jgi:hypothetical protein
MVMGCGLMHVAAFIAAANVSGPDGVTTGKDIQTYSGTTIVLTIPPFYLARTLGTPMLKYESSLLVRAKSSEANSTTAANQRQCSLLYMAQ